VSASGTPRTRFYGPSILRLDLPRGRAQPSAWRWIAATVVAVGASLLACFGLARVAIAVFPGLVGYGHFMFSDYGRLTVVGVVVACIGWPIVTWFTTSGRRLYLWLAAVVTVVSLVPDAWILHVGQPVAGVVTLAGMHFALAAITYPAMVFVAPQFSTRRTRTEARPSGS
jgi:hypothetical protein